MRNWNKAIQVALFFCVMPIFLAISSCATHDTSVGSIHSWTRDVDSLAKGKADSKFWSKIRPRSNLVDAYRRLGGFYQKQGKHREAIAEFIKAIKANTDDASLYNSLAVSYDALKQYTFSEMAYKDAIALAPDQSYLYNNYGCSSLLRGDREAAVILFEKAASLDSKSRRIKNNLSMASSGVDKQETTIAPAPAVLAVLDTSKEMTKAPVLAIADNSKETTSIVASSSDVEGNWFTHLIDSTLSFFGFVGDDKSVDENIVSVDDNKAQEKDVEESSIDTAIPNKTLQLAGVVANDRFLESHKQTTEATEPPLDKPVSVKREIAGITGNEQVVQSNRKVAIEVSNGNGVEGIAARTAAYFREQGQYVHRITNAKHFDFKGSIIFYREGYLQDAYKIALMVPGYQEMKLVESLGRSGVSVKLLLGEDMATMHFPEIMARLAPQRISNYGQTVTMMDW